MSAMDLTNYGSSDLQGYYSYPNIKAVYYGPGCIETALPKLLSTLGSKKALIVTGKSLFEKVSGLLL